MVNPSSVLNSTFFRAIINQLEEEIESKYRSGRSVCFIIEQENVIKKQWLNGRLNSTLKQLRFRSAANKSINLLKPILANYILIILADFSGKDRHLQTINQSDRSDTMTTLTFSLELIATVCNDQHRDTLFACCTPVIGQHLMAKTHFAKKTQQAQQEPFPPSHS